MARESKRKRDEKRFGCSQARLIDHVLDPMATWKFPAWMGDPSEADRVRFRRTCESLKGVAATAKILVADDVSKFFWEMSPKDEWDVVDDFPCCTPPFENMWVEAKAPDRVFVGNEFRPAPKWFESFGLLIRSVSTKNAKAEFAKGPPREQAVAYMVATIEKLESQANMGAIQAAIESPDPQGALSGLPPLELQYVGALNFLRRLEEGELTDDEIRKAVMAVGHSVLVDLFIREPLGTLCGPFLTWTLNLDEQGQALSPPMIGGYEIGSYGDALERLKGFASPLQSFLNIGLLAITFMHMGSTKLEAVEPPKQLNAIRQRNRKRPFLRYHTINVEAVKKILEAEGGLQANGLKMAMHLCRGNFARYNDTFMGRKLEKPIVIWRPAHVRGSAKQGVVISDYNVKAPANVPSTSQAS